jgi:uncharacterized membrane protein
MKKLAYIKSIIKSKNGVSNKRGSEMAETVLITAIMLVLVVTIFYPQMQTILTNALTTISTWISDTMALI